MKLMPLTTRRLKDAAKNLRNVEELAMTRGNTWLAGLARRKAKQATDELRDIIDVRITQARLARSRVIMTATTDQKNTGRRLL